MDKSVPNKYNRRETDYEKSDIESYKNSLMKVIRNLDNYPGVSEPSKSYEDDIKMIELLICNIGDVNFGKNVFNYYNFDADGADVIKKITDCFQGDFANLDLEGVLHLLSSDDFIEKMKVLEETVNDLNVSLKDYYDNPLMIAVIKNDLNLTKLLVNYGANPNIFSKFDKSTPLSLAIINENIDMIKYFVEELEVSIDYKTANGLTLKNLCSIIKDEEVKHYIYNLDIIKHNIRLEEEMKELKRKISNM
jgi:tetrahydromethanopterin S-methyltransferase subunit B